MFEDKKSPEKERALCSPGMLVWVPENGLWMGFMCMPAPGPEGKPL